MDNDNSDNSEFELVFEGPKDDSPDTLRALKGAMIADLDFSISEVQHFLESAPLTIRRSQDLSELEVACNKLKRAGARLFIIQRPDQGAVKSEENTEKKAESDKIATFLGFDLQESCEPNSPVETTNGNTAHPVPQEDDLVFELDLAVDEPSIPEPQETPAYTLTETSLEELDPELVQAQEAEVQTTAPDIKEAALAPADDTLQLELDKSASPAVPAPQPPQGPATTEIKSEGFDLTLALDEPEEKPKLEAVKPQPQTQALFDLAPEPEPKQEAEIEINIPTPHVLKELVQEGEKMAAPLFTLHPKHKTPEVIIERAEPVENESATADSSSEVSRPKSNTNIRRSSKLARKFKNPTLLYSLLAVTLLVAANWYFLHDNSKGIDSQHLERIIKSVAAEIDQSKKDVSLTNVEQSPTFGLKGDVTQGALKISWDLDNSNDVLNGGSISLINPPAPKLTPLEIGQGKISPPWLRKVNLDKLVFEKGDDNTWSAKTVAKAYVEYDGRGFRLVPDATITLSYDASQKTIKGTVEIKHGLEKASGDTNYVLEKIGPEQFKLYLKTDF